LLPFIAGERITSVRQRAMPITIGWNFQHAQVVFPET
jgi:hypothetical protein